MLKQLLKQIWAQRRMNTWILLELLVVSIIMWWAINPVFVTIYNRSIPQGFDYTDVYKITLGELAATSHRYHKSESDSVNRIINFDRMIDRIKQYPDVEALTITLNNSYPFSESYYGSMYNKDSISGQLQDIYFVAGDFFRVFRYSSAEDNSWESLSDIPVYANSIFITRDAEKQFFGKESGLGKVLTGNDSTKIYRIAGVLNYVKMNSDEQPLPVCFHPLTEINPQHLPNDIQLFIRVKEGTPQKPFIHLFREQMIGKIQIGNYYLKQITSGEKIKRDSQYSNGSANQVRLQSGLTFFFLVSMLLGIVGTFWFRSESRRGEMGLRIAMGSTRRLLRWQLILEAWLMTTLAALVGFFIVCQFIYAYGFSTNDSGPSAADYLTNNSALHFLAVCGIVYLLMMVTVFIGVWFPAGNASHVNPVDALRDE